MKNLKKVLALVLAVVMIMSVVTVASAKTYTGRRYEAYRQLCRRYRRSVQPEHSRRLSRMATTIPLRLTARSPVPRQPRSWRSSTTRLPTAQIKGQDAISALYSNAQNPFVDCNTSWALPYINYCRITGLADGMTATTYAPEA